MGGIVVGELIFWIAAYLEISLLTYFFGDIAPPGIPSRKQFLYFFIPGALILGVNGLLIWSASLLIKKKFGVVSFGMLLSIVVSAMIMFYVIFHLSNQIYGTDDIMFKLIPYK